MCTLLTKSNDVEYNIAMGAVPKGSPITSCRTPQMRLLAMQEVAERLGVSLQRVYEMGRLGLLPLVRLGRQIRIEEGQLTSWVEGGGKGLPAGWKRTPE